MAARLDDLETTASTPLPTGPRRSSRMLHVQLRDDRPREEPLRPYLKELLRASYSERRVLGLHLEGLTGLDTSLFADLVWLVLQAHAVGVGLTVFYDGRRPWQAMSLGALRSALRAEGQAGTAVSFSEV
jgi:hypothetical protein